MVKEVKKKQEIAPMHFISLEKEVENVLQEFPHNEVNKNDWKLSLERFTLPAKASLHL